MERLDSKGAPTNLYSHSSRSSARILSARVCPRLSFCPSLSRSLACFSKAAVLLPSALPQVLPPLSAPQSLLSFLGSTLLLPAALLSGLSASASVSALALAGAHYTATQAILAYFQQVHKDVPA